MKAIDIKFKGKCIDSDYWVEGHYFQSPLTQENANDADTKDGWFFLTGKTRHCIEKDHNVYIVDPETIELVQPLASTKEPEKEQNDIKRKISELLQRQFREDSTEMIYDIIADDIYELFSKSHLLPESRSEQMNYKLTPDLTGKDWLKLPKEETYMYYKNCYKMLERMLGLKGEPIADIPSFTSTGTTLISEQTEAVDNGKGESAEEILMKHFPLVNPDEDEWAKEVIKCMTEFASQNKSVTDEEIEKKIREYYNSSFLRLSDMAIHDIVKGAIFFRDHLSK